MNQKLWAIGVVETRVRLANKDKVLTNLKLRNWSLIHNYAVAPLGRIRILFNFVLANVVVVKTTDQLVHCTILWKNTLFD